MNTFIYAVLIPVAIYIVASKLATHFDIKNQRLLLVLACVLFGASIFFPSPPIYGEQTEFFTHFFGGGVFMGLIWLYFKPLFKAATWYYELAWLYVLTSALGVLNELYELFIYVVGLNTKPVTDTSWDLLANTLGVLAFYGCYRLAKRLFFSR
jgi:hypothetical protein